MNYPKGIIDEATARQWNGTVVDRVVKTRWKRQHWECNGFAPLDTSILAISNTLDLSLSLDMESAKMVNLGGGCLKDCNGSVIN